MLVPEGYCCETRNEAEHYRGQCGEFKSKIIKERYLGANKGINGNQGKRNGVATDGMR
jgi:hypothetical protein